MMSVMAASLRFTLPLQGVQYTIVRVPRAASISESRSTRRFPACPRASTARLQPQLQRTHEGSDPERPLGKRNVNVPILGIDSSGYPTIVTVTTTSTQRPKVLMGVITGYGVSPPPTLGPTIVIDWCANTGVLSTSYDLKSEVSCSTSTPKGMLE